MKNHTINAPFPGRGIVLNMLFEVLHETSILETKSAGEKASSVLAAGAHSALCHWSGLITANVDNDATGITGYSLAGAQYGYGLLWAVVLVTISLIVVQEMVARMGVVTGKGLADLIRERFGVRITFWSMLLLLIANTATTVAEFAGVAGAMDIFGVSPFIAVPVAAVVVWFLVIRGSYYHRHDRAYHPYHLDYHHLVR
jgi:hypothetical protein